MGKGISLEQFRNEIETDASRRVVAQEKTIREQKEQIKRFMSIIAERDDDIRVLCNRCIALSHGMFCLFCGLKERCTREIHKK